MRVGVLTGGGDCPGLNAVIRAIVRQAERTYGDELIGFLDAWDGVRARKTIPLTVETMRGTLPRGGTVLGTKRGSPFDTDSGPDEVAATIAEAWSIDPVASLTIVMFGQSARRVIVSGSMFLPVRPGML